MMKDKSRRCIFCGRASGEVSYFISSKMKPVGVCSSCVKVCSKLIQEMEIKIPTESAIEDEQNVSSITDLQLKPKQIKEFLDQYIIGQDKGKKAISVAVYNHYKRIYDDSTYSEEDSDIELQKSNVLLVGPTGSGKTYMVQTLAKVLNVPFVIADATVFTQSGYVGKDVESIISSLYRAAEYDAERTEKGIIYIDEIDKITCCNDNFTRDISGEGVQQELLKIIEGTTISISIGEDGRGVQRRKIDINTKNILFIFGGAFDGIEKIIKRRTETKNSIGFITNIDGKQHEIKTASVTSIDLIEYGIIPELIGRIPVIASLENIDRDAMVKIITEPQNALLKQYKKSFRLDNVDLEFEQAAIEAVADKAILLHTGARGIKNIMEDVMMDLMYEIPSDETIEKCVITKGVIEGTEAPLFKKKICKNDMDI